jgi:hypothetical protein
MRLNENAPSRPDITLKVCPAPVNVTWAFAMAAPWGSTTTAYRPSLRDGQALHKDYLKADEP